MTTHRLGPFFLWSSKPSFNFYLIIILCSNSAELAVILKWKQVQKTDAASCQPLWWAANKISELTGIYEIFLLTQILYVSISEDSQKYAHHLHSLELTVWFIVQFMDFSSMGKLTVVFVLGKNLSYLDSSNIQGFGHLYYSVPGLFRTDCFLWFWLYLKKYKLMWSNESLLQRKTPDPCSLKPKTRNKQHLFSHPDEKLASSISCFSQNLRFAGKVSKM